MAPQGIWYHYESVFVWSYSPLLYFQIPFIPLLESIHSVLIVSHIYIYIYTHPYVYIMHLLILVFFILSCRSIISPLGIIFLTPLGLPLTFLIGRGCCWLILSAPSLKNFFFTSIEFLVDKLFFSTLKCWFTVVLLLLFLMRNLLSFSLSSVYDMPLFSGRLYHWINDIIDSSILWGSFLMFFVLGIYWASWAYNFH